MPQTLVLGVINKCVYTLGDTQDIVQKWPVCHRPWKIEILGVISLFGYLNRWNDSMGTTLEEGAMDSGKKYLGQKGWDGGKHLG